MKLIFFLIIFTGLITQAQLTMNPAPVSGGIELTASQTYIYLTNPSLSSVTTNLTVDSNSSGIAISLNRCATILAKQTCYVVISFSNYGKLKTQTQVAFKNSSSSLALLTYNPVVPVVESSSFSVSSLTMNDFSNYTLSVTNKTLSTKSYSPIFSGTDASKFSIALNRCSSIPAGGKCDILIKLAPQLAGSYSASLSESQVTGSVSISSTITSSTIGVIQPPTPSISIAPSSLSFGTIIKLGQTSLQTITLTNNGNVSISPIASVQGTGLHISLNRCLVLLGVGQSCSISLYFDALNSMSNGPQSGLSFHAQASSTSSDMSIPVSATLNIPISLLSNSGSISPPSGTPPLIYAGNDNELHRRSLVSSTESVLKIQPSNKPMSICTGSSPCSFTNGNISRIRVVGDTAYLEYSFYGAYNGNGTSLIFALKESDSDAYFVGEGQFLYQKNNFTYGNTKTADYIFNDKIIYRRNVYDVSGGVPSDLNQAYMSTDVMSVDSSNNPVLIKSFPTLNVGGYNYEIFQNAYSSGSNLYLVTQPFVGGIEVSKIYKITSGGLETLLYTDTSGDLIAFGNTMAEVGSDLYLLGYYSVYDLILKVNASGSTVLDLNDTSSTGINKSDNLAATSNAVFFSTLMNTGSDHSSLKKISGSTISEIMPMTNGAIGRSYVFNDIYYTTLINNYTTSRTHGTDFSVLSFSSSLSTVVSHSGITYRENIDEDVVFSGGFSGTNQFALMGSTPVIPGQVSFEDGYNLTGFIKFGASITEVSPSAELTSSGFSGYQGDYLIYEDGHVIDPNGTAGILGSFAPSYTSMP